MKVAWSPDALVDPEEIGSFIRTDNPERAASFLVEIVDAGEGLAGMPRAFPVMAGLRHKQIRRRRFGRYLIFYRIGIGRSGDRRVEILHVVHSARDYVKLPADIL